MIRIAVLALAGLLSACSFWEYYNADPPQPVSGNENRFVVYDANGVSKASANGAAQGYCDYFGKTAELVSQGGDAPKCVSRPSDVCATYTCK